MGIKMSTFIKDRRGNENSKVTYKFIRMCGVDPIMARRMRYWTLSHIILYLNSIQVKEHEET